MSSELSAKLSHAPSAERDDRSAGAATAPTNHLGEGFRKRRRVLFENLCRSLPQPIKILDVGGTVEFWKENSALQVSLTLLNIFEQAPVPGVTALVGDACDLSQFADQSFDIVFSNSVIGHVGGWERQKQMAREIQRVGRRYFVQTPNQGFPIDWRTLMPFFHWFSPRFQAWCFQRFPVGRYRRVSNSNEALLLATRVRNVTRREVGEMFPAATVVSERVGGFTKSFIIHHGF